MNKIRKIGILSDTHGLLRDEVKDALKGCDVILHAGDINKQEIINELNIIAPVYVVRGNNDKEWAKDIPEHLELRLSSTHVYMTHKKKDLPEDLSKYHLVVYGHSHRYEEKWIGDTVFLNPGSCGPRRFNQEITLAVLTMKQEGGFEITKVEILHKQKNVPIGDKDLKVLIVRTISEIEKGKDVEQIAKKLHIDQDLAEQICRLYLTHPGVDADGIMTKMGL